MGERKLWGICTGDEPAVMAIVNATPDSFYVGSRLDLDRGSIAARVRAAVEQGAAILDVGGYSTRPGAEQVPVETEIERLTVAMDVIRTDYPRMPVSIDTFRAVVARVMLDKYGPCIVNDISAGTADAAMLPLVAAAGVPYIAMHLKGTPTSMHDMTTGGDVGEEVVRYFTEKLEVFDRLGIRDVVVDPGFGFSKSLRQNYELLRALPRLAALGRPLLAGLSRKSMIWRVVGGRPETALAGTCALHWQALAGGANILRAHDVREAVDVVKLFKYYDDTGKGHS